jgi:hypothetical protein
MRQRLINCVGSHERFYIKKTNHEVVIKFIRGFADPDRNIILISEQCHSLGMNIIEIKNIEEVQPWMMSAA